MIKYKIALVRIISRRSATCKLSKRCDATRSKRYEQSITHFGICYLERTATAGLLAPNLYDNKGVGVQDDFVDDDRNSIAAATST